MIPKTDFKTWTTSELVGWVDVMSTYSLLNINNSNIYIQALQELQNREDDANAY